MGTWAQILWHHYTRKGIKTLFSIRADLERGDGKGYDLTPELPLRNQMGACAQVYHWLKKSLDLNQSVYIIATSQY